MKERLIWEQNESDRCFVDRPEKIFIECYDISYKNDTAVFHMRTPYELIDDIRLKRDSMTYRVSSIKRLDNRTFEITGWTKI